MIQLCSNYSHGLGKITRILTYVFIMGTEQLLFIESMLAIEIPVPLVIKSPRIRSVLNSIVMAALKANDAIVARLHAWFTTNIATTAIHLTGCGLLYIVVLSAVFLINVAVSRVARLYPPGGRALASPFTENGGLNAATAAKCYWPSFNRASTHVACRTDAISQ